MRDPRPGAVLALLAACLLAIRPAGSADSPQDDAPAEAAFSELAAGFRKHCLKVFLHGKSHEGRLPPNPAYAADIRNERPTRIGGYWWDDRHAIIEDTILQDHFIRAIEIETPFSERRYPARVAGRFVKLQAVLLEILPDEDGALPESNPLRFIDGEVEEAFVLGYGWTRGEWGIGADEGFGALFRADSGRETTELKGKGVIVDARGFPLGLAFGNRVAFDDDPPYWAGRELPYTACHGIAEAAASRTKLEEKLAAAVLETRFSLRVKVDEDETDSLARLLEPAGGPGRRAEIRAAGLVVGEHHLLAPAPLGAGAIARIENITVVTADGRELRAEFAGALRDYMAVLVQTREPLPVDKLPAGFTLLNPLLVSEEAFRPEKKPAPPALEYLQRWHIDYALGRRRQTVDYDRCQGAFHGYRDDVILHTFTNEPDGSLAFDVADDLVALALTPRLPEQNRTRHDPGLPATPGFRPLDFLAKRLRESDVIDPALRPARETEGQRLIDLGAEFQALDENTARLFLASRETRGGQIGLLVTHVYPGSPAADIGLAEHDILLRVYVEGQAEPLELHESDAVRFDLFDLDDMTMHSIRSLMGMIPPPWPPRENTVSAILTATGVGRLATVEFLREGETIRQSFTTRYTDPDFQHANKERFPRLGLTVKPVTYEVQRYFRRPDASGVVVSHVEEGGRSAIGGLQRYLLATHVDGAPVRDLDDFKEKVSAFEKGGAPAVELTIAEFGKTRLAKIE